MNILNVLLFKNAFFRKELIPLKIINRVHNNVQTNNPNIFKKLVIFSLNFKNTVLFKPFSTNACILNRHLDVNTNVLKDVIIYKYENPKFYKILNVFALCQFGFWTYLSHFAFTSLKDAPVDRSKEANLEWYRKLNLGDNKYRNTIAILCCVIGYGILAAAWSFTLKSVRFLVLRKGGENVTFVTYGPFGKNRMMTVNLKHVSSQESRQNARVQLPIKVQNTYLYYMLDMRGQFTNGKLFDYTAGMKRNFK